MKHVIEGYYHKKGRHCASTAIRDGMVFRGHKISEAFCFGLGRGLGAFYMSNPDFSPSKWLMTRGADLEEHFFTSLKIPFVWRQAADAQTAWRETKKALDANMPVLLQTDLHYLDYYNTKTHFNRHAVLLWGYDEERGVGFLSDTDREGLIEISLESLARARSSAFPPGPVKYDWFPFQRWEHIGDLKDAALGAIRLNALELSGVPEDFPLKMGLMALKALAEDLPNWKDAADWKWSARFAYQAIEKRGTGGGAFRKMYADFLGEVEGIAPEIREMGLSNLMRRSADKWSELALSFKNISEKEEPSGFEEVAQIANELHNLETEFCGNILDGII